MRTRIHAGGTVALAVALAAGGGLCAEWPVARHFDSGHLYRVALPMGGMGAGSVSLSGRGELCDWEIMNRPNKGHPSGECNAFGRTFFAIRAKGAKTDAARMLAGPIEEWEYLGGGGTPVPQAGFPRFTEASFDGAFPFGTVHLRDAALPLKVDIRGFSPFIPGDSAASSLPVASLEYVVENASDEPLEISVVAYVRNLVGINGTPQGRDWHFNDYWGGAKDNRTLVREADGLRGLLCTTTGVATNDEAWGSIALVTPDADVSVTYRDCFPPNWWSTAYQDFWDDFTDDGELSPRAKAEHCDVQNGAMCVKRTVPARSRTSFRFAWTWTFPNRFAWSKTVVGNWYAGLYADAWDAAAKIVPRLPDLEARSRAFVDGILAEDVPAEIKEAALSNLAVLKSQTVFRVPTGHLMAWEGANNHTGSCEGTCTHVWNYENAVACLFPDMARTMRDVEFNHALDPETGRMDFRADLPLGKTRNGRVAADGQMGCVMKAYRDWRICGDDAWLKAIWPRVRKALEFAWSEWDADRDGMMEGSQHNTMDVNYWGPNPQMQFWYMGALRAAEEMAKATGDADFAKTCRGIFEKASKGTDGQLFNGDYYEQRIPADRANEWFQLGPGCLVDQLVGQQMAHLWGLGDLAAPANLRKTCESIMRWNWLDDFSGHFTNMRVFCTGRESGLLMASWPKGRLKVPFPYYSEVMTGFEYVAAAEMIFQGMDEEALRVIRAIRDRHDGLRRNPFSEPECGHNYARSMASWNCLLAWRMKHGESGVRLAECPDCTSRMRLTPDGRSATVNLSRLKDDDPAPEVLARRVEAMKARARMLMGRAADAVTAAPGRPLTGWASWNAFGCDISEELIRAQAEAMATNGLRAAGYRYVNIDDGAFGGRDAEGRILPNPTRFPRGFKGLVSRIHALGLKAGTYSDGGESTCAGLFNGDTLGIGTGLYNHEERDAADRFLGDGFDFIKVDWCGGRKLNLSRRDQYTRIAAAMRGTGRDDLHLNICCWAYPGTWCENVAGSWRVKGDIRANWPSVRHAILDNLYRSAYCSRGHYNDMDMMQVGRLVGQTRQARFREFSSDTGLTPAEETTHFALWCMLSSPLMIGCDLRDIPAPTLRLLTNRHLLATSQNDLGLAAYVARREGDAYLLVKDADERFGTARHVAVFNAGDGEREFRVDFADVDLGGTVEALDLVECADLGAFTGSLPVRVPAHGTRVLRLDAAERLERRTYEAEDGRLSQYGARGEVRAYAHDGASGGVRIGYLGNGESNDLVWRDVRIARGGERTLEFRFASCEDRFFFVQVDGGARHRVEAKCTNGGIGTASLRIALAPGVHAIRVSNPESWAPDMDAMYVR